MSKQRVLIIGEIFVDTHLDMVNEGGPLVRLGGIFHAARACSALDCDYALAYYAPEFLEDDINYYSCLLKTKACYRLGYINKAPNIMLVNESKESGSQGYYNILREQAEFIKEKNIIKLVNEFQPTDILVFPGRYNLDIIMNELVNYKGKVHIDFHYDSDNIINAIKVPIETVILSTSSSYFKKECQGSLKGIQNYFKEHSVKNFLVKENRGGSYYYHLAADVIYEAPAYYVPIMHSVGVGDVFNAVFIFGVYENDIEKSLRLSSLCAARYAETMDFDQYKKNIKALCSNLDNNISLHGIRLSWETRLNKHIYLAAPDFPDVNTDILDLLEASLRYHNFQTHRPIKENGLATVQMKKAEELQLYYKDVELINRCDLLIAILLYNDPGTLVELGMFKQLKKPTIVFDPNNYCNNMFVRNTPDFLCKSIDDTVNAVFDCLGRG